MAINDLLVIPRFRSDLDQLFDEGDVLAFSRDEAKRLLDATAAAIFVDRRDKGSGHRRLDPSGDPRLVGPLYQELAERTIKEASTLRAAKALSVPLKNIGMVMGALLLELPPFAHPADEEVLEVFASQIAASLRRVRLLQAFREITMTTARALEADRLLDSLLLQITEQDMDYALISVADPYRNDIAAVRGRNVPPAWVRAASHSLASDDIISAVYASKKPSDIVEGYLPSLDQRIYWRFDHERYARCFEPLLLRDGSAIGVVEFGCLREKRARVLTDDAREAVRKTINDMARPEISLIRSYVLLETVAGHAIDALGADSASIFVYEGAIMDEEVPLPKPILFGGAGQASAKFLADFPPRDNGFGRQAMLSNMLVTEHATVISKRHPELFRAGVRALLAVPLHFEDKSQLSGVLFINHWRPHRISTAEVEVARTFARQAEVAIYNHLLIRRTKERYERTFAYARVLDIISTLPNTDSSDRALNNNLTTIAGYVLQVAGADSVIIYEFSTADQKFRPPVMKGYFADRGAVHDEMPSDGVARHVLFERKSSLFECKARSSAILTEKKSRERFIIREGIESSATLLLKDGEQVVGIMFVNYRDPQTFSERQRLELDTLAATAAIAINRSQDRKERELERLRDQRRRQNELEALRAVQEAVAHSDLRRFAPVLQVVLEKVVGIISADSGFIMWKDSSQMTLRSLADVNCPPDVRCPVRQSIAEGIVGMVARTGTPCVSADVTVDETVRSIYRRLLPTTRSEIAIPILYVPDDTSTVLGVINCEATRSGAFGDNDKAFLEAVSRQLVLALRCVERLDESLTPDRIRALIAEVIDDASLSLESRLRVILTGVTAGEGLGFSRAMIFRREEGDRLTGVLAVGALCRREAEDVWKNLELAGASSRTEVDRRESRASQPEVDLRRLLTLAKEEAIEKPLTTFLKGPVVAQCLRQSAVADCLETGESRRLRFEESDALKQALKEKAGGDAVHTDTILVPLKLGGSICGVLAVDNEFLPAAEPAIRSWRRKGEEAHALLVPFANLAAEAMVGRTEVRAGH